MKGERMWEWWRKVEEDYREKRRGEDELRERERQERARWRRGDEGLAEVLKNPPPFEELVAEMERNWGIEVEWERWGMSRPKPRGVQVEVIESHIVSRTSQGDRRDCQDRRDRRDREDGADRFLRGALAMVLTGRWR